ncbi:MAG: hypothetical protein R2860_04765 [Desulfobacterales bacterium]
MSDGVAGSKPVYFPKVTQANVLVCLTQEAFSKYRKPSVPAAVDYGQRIGSRYRKNIDARRMECPCMRR